MSEENKKPIITEQEAQFLVNKLVESRKKHKKPLPTVEECSQLLDWAAMSLTGYTLLDLIFKNYIDVDIAENGEPLFSNPNYVPAQECMDEKEKFDNRKLLNDGAEILKDMLKNDNS